MHKTKYLMIQDGLKKILLMFFFIISARYLSDVEFGQYQQILLIVSLWTIIFSAGVPTAVSYFYGQSTSFAKRVSVFQKFFFFQFFLLLTGTVLLFFLDEVISLQLGNPYIETLSCFIVLFFITSSSIEFFKNLSVVSNQLKSYLYLTTSIQLISMIFCIFVVVVSSNLAYILFVNVFFNCIIYILLVRKNLKYFIATSRERLISKRELKYVISMGSVALVGVLNGYVDQLMVSMLLSVEDYAVLKIGAFQIPFISVITGSILTVMIPVVSELIRESKTDEIVEIWKSSIEKASILLVPIVIFCLVFAEEIIIGFFGEKYSPAVIIFQVYMLQWLRAVVIFGGVMGAIGLEKQLFKNTFIVTLLNIVLNYIMILEFGILGAAITTTFLNYFGAILLIKDINKKLKKSFFIYFPYKVYITSLCSSLFTCLFLKYAFVGVTDSFLGVIIVSLLFYIAILCLQMKIIYGEVSMQKFKGLI